jgi:hypothetical protein
VQEAYREEHQGDGGDQFAPQEALLLPGKFFVIDFNTAAAQLSFLFFVTLPI